jgi:hypothetical protein
MGTTVFRIRIDLIFRRCCNLVTPSRFRWAKRAGLGPALYASPGAVRRVSFSVCPLRHIALP